MLSYLKFTFKAILKKPSIWITTFIILGVFIFMTYIFPLILKRDINLTLRLWTIPLMVFTVIAPCIAYVTSKIFRSPIDDGTEILLISKPITRTNIIWSKIIVLSTIIIIQSILVAIIPSFLKFFEYGINKPFVYVLGYFLLMLIICLVISSITILLSLKLKSSSSTLISTGLIVLINIISVVNFILSSTPGSYAKFDNLSLSNHNLITFDSNKNLLRKEGYLLSFDNDFITSKTTNFDGEYIINNDNKNNVIQYFNHKFIKRANWKVSSIFDVGFQWLKLLSLTNFFPISTSLDINKSSIFNTDIPINYYFEFHQQDLKNIQTFSIKNLYSSNNIVNEYLPSYNTNFVLWFNNLRFLDINFDYDFYRNNKYFIVPYINWNPLNPTYDSTKIDVYFFDNDMSSYFQTIFDLIINDKNPKSIYNLYKKYLTQLNTNNVKLGLLLTFNEFLFNYLYYGYYSLFYNALSPDSINKESLIKSIVFLKPNPNIEQYIKNISYLQFYSDVSTYVPSIHINPSFFTVNPQLFLTQPNIRSYISILNISIYSILKIQEIFYEYLNQISNSSNKILDLSTQPDYVKSLVDLFVPNIKRGISPNRYFLFGNYESAHTQAKLLEEIMINGTLNSDKLNELNTIIDNHTAYITNFPYSFIEKDQFATFAVGTIHNYLNFYGLVFGWIGFGMILLVIASLLYYRKDIK